MIDIESEVYDPLYDLLCDKLPGIFVTGETVAAPTEFPCVSIEEVDNYTKESTRDSGGNENHAVVMYEVTIHSNKATGRKSECRAIAAMVSDYFQGKGFTRLSMNPAPGGGEKVYRLVCRFAGTVSADHYVFRR